MDEKDGVVDPALRYRHLRTLLLVVLGVVYIASFWGLVATKLPKPLDGWAYFYLPYVEPWWQSHVLPRWPDVKQRSLLILAASVVLGMLIPMLVLKLTGYKLRDCGIGLPNVLGYRLVLISVLLAIPFGLWLLWSMSRSAIPLVFTFDYACGLAAIIPEHFLICGVYVAVLLPDRKLPSPVRITAMEGPLPTRILRWFGLAQRPPTPGSNRLLAWFGLTRLQLIAIVVSGMLFWMVHFGKPSLELFLSLPGGIAVAYVTLRSHSIWPAVIAHYALNAAAILAVYASRWIA